MIATSKLKETDKHISFMPTPGVLSLSYTEDASDDGKLKLRSDCKEIDEARSGLK